MRALHCGAGEPFKAHERARATSCAPRVHLRINHRLIKTPGPDGTGPLDVGFEPASCTVVEGKGAKGKGNPKPPGSLRLVQSVYHIRRNIKLYIVLDEILTLFEIETRPRIDVGLWTST